MMGDVTALSRPSEVGSTRARRLAVAAGREIRDARLDRDLSLRAVSRSVGLSESQVSRIERGLVRHVSVWDLARLHAVVGLELSLRSFPAGQPIRDAAHLSLLVEFAAGLHPSLGWATEVPLPIVGDQRSWDGLIRGAGWRYGVEAETVPRDAQALTRRLNLKARDGQVDGVILVVRGTARARAFLREAVGQLKASFPVDGNVAIERLRSGVDPGGSSVVVLRPRARPTS